MHDLLLFNMSSYSDWDNQRRGSVNRNFHVLQQMLKDPQVGRILAIDYLPHNLRRQGRVFLEDIMESNIENRTLKKKRGKLLQWSWEEKLYQMSNKLYVYSTMRNPLVVPKLIMRRTQQMLNRLDFTRTVLWSYNPLFAVPFSSNRFTRKVFDAVQDWRAFPLMRKHMHRLSENYKTIGAKADCVFTSTKAQKSMFSDSSNVHCVSNGVDLQRFVRGTQPKPSDLQPFYKPVIMYVGIISPRLDFDLIENVAKYIDAEVVMIGAISSTVKQRIKNMPSNVHFFGPRAYQNIPIYLSHADVGIIPHHQASMSTYTNPLKLYEYLAIGLPVVSVPIEGASAFSHVMYLADKPLFIDAVRQALAEEPTERKRVSRRNTVVKLDWEQAYAGMKAYCQQSL